MEAPQRGPRLLSQDGTGKWPAEKEGVPFSASLGKAWEGLTLLCTGSSPGSGHPAASLTSIARSAVVVHQPFLVVGMEALAHTMYISSQEAEILDLVENLEIVIC